MPKIIIFIIMPILFASSCAVAPIQSARIKSNLSITSRISFSDARYLFNYERLDTTQHHQSSTTIYSVNMLEDGDVQALSFLPYLSWGIQNRVELSGYIVPGPPTILFTAGGNIKVNVLDFKGKQRLFRDIAIALSAGGNAVSMEWENMKNVFGSLIIGTYHRSAKNEFEFVFTSSAVKTSVSAFSDNGNDEDVLLYAVDIGLAALFWPSAANRVNICGGFFYRIPVSEHIHCESEYYKTSVEKKVSPWIFQTALTVNLVMP